MIYVIAVLAVILYYFIIYRFLGSRGPSSLLSVLLCIGFGVLSAGMSLALEYGWSLWLGEFILSHKSLVFIESFFGVALIEEGTKWLFLVYAVSRWNSFARYSDGIIYTCGIAAGFTLVENLLYAVIETSLPDMAVRVFTAIPVHFLFAIVMGFLFARYKLEGKQFLWFSLLIPVVLHGLYDFFILQQYAELLMGAALLVLAGCLSLSIWICNTAKRADRLRVIDSA